MGRHGGGPISGRAFRISVPVVAIGVLIVAAVGFAIWLWSIRSVTDPIDADPVDAYAVVLSSPSCTSGSGATVIDLDVPPAVRSSLSACGRRTNERLAVQYLRGHPEQVRLAGTTIAHNTALGLWLPIAIVAAGLLAVIATIALMIDRRKSKHGGVASRVTVAQLRAKGTNADAPGTPVPSASAHPPTRVPGGAADGPSNPFTVDRAAGGDTDSNDRHRRDAEREAATPDLDGGADNPDVTSRIAMAHFAQENPTPFRPSEIAVEEDLFTHRGPEAPDR